MFYSGVAGTDYSVYASVPETNFDCNAQEFPGIYSDTEAECQVPVILIIVSRTITKTAVISHTASRCTKYTHYEL